MEIVILIRPINCCFFLLKRVESPVFTSLEKNLTTIKFSELKTFVTGTETKYKYVAVYDPRDYCRRGRIISVKNGIFNVLLIDNGNMLKCRKEELRILPKYLQDIKSRVFMAGILSVIPESECEEISNNYWERLYNLRTIDGDLACAITGRNFVFKKQFDYANIMFGNLFDKDLNYNIINLPCSSYRLTKIDTLQEFFEGWNLDYIEDMKDNGLYELLKIETERGLSVKIADQNDTVGNSRKSNNDWRGKKESSFFVDTEHFIEPIISITYSNLNKKTVQGITLSTTAFTSSQLFAITYISSGRDTILIDSYQEKRTASYIFSLISMLRDQPITNSKRLRAVIICPYYSTCTFVYNVFKKYIGLSDDITCFVVGNTGNENNKNKTDELLGGCYDILITVPLYFKYLLLTLKTMMIKNLTHLIFEDMQILLENFSQEVKEIYATITNSFHRIGCNPPQTVMLSNEWSAELGDLARMFVLIDPAYVITNPLEAAIYCNVKCQLIYVDEEDELERQNVLKELVKNALKSKSVAIVCSNDEAQRLYSFLQSDPSIETYLLSPSEAFNFYHDVQKYLSRMLRHKPVIICVDECLYCLKDLEFQCLINYSLPRSYDLFTSQFSLINSCLNTRNVAGEIHIIVSDRYRMVFPKLCRLMKRLNVSIPNGFEETVQEILEIRKQGKTNAHLCLKFINFGRCSDNSCVSRHIICEADKPFDFIPQVGSDVRLKITHVYSPSHYVGFITAVKIDDKWKNIDTRTSSLAFKMQMHFSRPSARQCIENVKIGELAAFEKTPRNFFRVKIVNTEYDDKFERTNFIISFLDTGEIMGNVPDHKLYVLPDNLKEIQINLAEFIYCNLLPVDKKLDWLVETNQFVRKLFKQQLETENPCYFQGKISLALSGYIWFERLHVIEELQPLRTVTIHPSVKSELIKNGMAIENGDHLKTLLQHTDAKDNQN